MNELKEIKAIPKIGNEVLTDNGNIQIITYWTSGVKSYLNLLITYDHVQED